jgi:uncharacterized protein
MSFLSKPIQPHYLLLEPTAVKPAGWIEEFCHRDAAGITGSLDRLCAESASGIYFENKVDDRQEGGWSSWWNGETEGNWMEAVIGLGTSLQDAALLEKSRLWLEKLLGFQEPDGYLGVYRPSFRYRFDEKRSGDLWTQSRLLLVLLDAFQIGREDRYLQAALRLAGRILAAYPASRRPISAFEVADEDGSKTHGLMIVEPMLILHGLTGRKDLLDFCVRLYEDYSHHAGTFPGDDCSLPNLLDPAVPFVGHGPHTCEQLRIPLLLYFHTGRKVYWKAFREGMHKLKKNLGLSGSCKSDELIGAYRAGLPLNERNYAQLVESLPLPSAGYEYCSTTELSNTLLAALALTGDPIYADMQEWLVFNAAMAARHNDGKSIQYLCADNLFAATRALGERWDYSPTHTDAAVCCAPNSGKVIPHFLQHMWMRDARDGSLTALLYGPCRLAVEGGYILEETTYPFEKTIRFRFQLERPLHLALKLRLPGWARQADLLLNQVKLDAGFRQDGGMARLEQTWQNGDELLLRMDWQPQLTLAVDNSAAVTYGPLLYSLHIPEKASHTCSYPLEGFHDSDYTPLPAARWEYTFVLEQDGSPGKFITPVFIDVPPGSYEWEHPPVVLQAKMLNPAAEPEVLQLVPLGTTLLRRTTFPWVRR